MKHINRRTFFKLSGLGLAASVSPPWLFNRGEAGGSPASQRQTPHQVLMMDLPDSAYLPRFSQLINQGYRPIWFQGSDNGLNPPTFSAIWVRDGLGPWYEWHNLTPGEYQAKFDMYASQGFRPISVTGYRDNFGNILLGAIWLYSPGIGYYGIHGADGSQYQTFVNENIARGYTPQVVDGYGAGEYIAIFADIPVSAWEARHGLTSAGYQSFVSAFAPLGYRVTCVSSYQINGNSFFAACMVKDGITDWAAHHDNLPDDLSYKAVNYARNDYQPIVIENYNNIVTPTFAGVWIKKARAWTATGAYNPNLGSFDNALQSFMQARHIPCGSLAVTKDSRLVYARGYHWDGYTVDPVNPDSLFRIASLTKPLTSMAVMRLVQEGRLQLTDRLTRLLVLPAPLDPRLNDITLLELLQHQGGWNRDLAYDPMFVDLALAFLMGLTLPVSQQDIINFMTTRYNLDFTPGTMYNYSNYGYLLLGRIIEAVTGQSYANYMQTQVFAPLGISRIVLGRTEFEYRQPGEVPYFTTLDYNGGLYPNVRRADRASNAMGPYGGEFNLENMDSHGGFLASAVDLARFATAFDPTGLYPVLTSATVETIFAVPSIGANPDGSWYGCGWFVRPAGSGINTWHDGRLTGTCTLMVRRFDGLNWVVLFDQRDDPSGLNYGSIDGALHAAANAVTNWPGGDLFPDYNLPSRYGYRAFLPLIGK